MIDLHMHTINSDGTDTTEELLKKCEKLELEYISITDHDTCEAYNDMKNINVKKVFKGKIISGCEFTTTYKGRTIEILGYDVDINIINKWKDKYYTQEKKQERIEFCKTKAIKNLYEVGININKDSLDTDCSYDRAIHRKLLLNKEENEKKLGKGMLDSVKNLFRLGFANPDSPLFIDVTRFRPTPKEVTDMIHKSGGKAFLAHAYQYAFNNTLNMITELRQECDLDGVEAFHSTFTLDQMMEIQEYAKKNNLYISGGSDYHGRTKPEINLKTGCNNLHISKNILEWKKED